MRFSRTKYRILASALFCALAWATHAAADDHVRGIITGRGDGGTLIVQQIDGSKVIVSLSDAADVHRIDGVRKVRVSAGDLIPGLRIRAGGKYETPDRFVAKSLTFSKADFRTAAAIQGGVTPTDQRSVKNERDIQQHSQQLSSHESALNAHNDQLAAQGSRIAANEQGLTATNGAVAATNARIANLDDYTVVKTMTVYFANGKYNLSKDGKAALLQIAGEAKDKNYMVQVQAFASDVGPWELNQKLTMQRADVVTAWLQQNGVAPTNIFVPAAMGTTGQVAPNTTAKGQEENRRAVISLLENKGVNGK